MFGYLDFTLYGNSSSVWALAGIATAVVIGAASLVQWLVARHFERRADRSDTLVDDVTVAVLRATRVWFLITVGIWVASQILTLPDVAASKVTTVVVLVLLAQLGLWGQAGIRTWTDLYSRLNLEADAASVTNVKALSFLGRLVLWTLISLVALENLGVDVTTLIAGLGVAGIAVALALQNVLGDLFASLSIVLDKPFVIGDFIIVDGFLGSVEHIGLKTTRLRSLSGEQLVFANSDLLKSRIRNYKRMYERRIVFSFGVVYQTPLEKLRTIPPAVREIIDAQEQTRFDRAHFKAYGAHSLDFEVVYYVLAPDYNVYMDVQQAINFGIYARFEAEEIEFAYPTQTLYISGEDGDRGGRVDAADEPAPVG